MDFVGAEQLLGEFQLWNDLDSKAKRRYQAQLAPDFRLMMFLQRDENALSSYLGELLDPNGSHGQGDLYLTKFLALLPDTGFALSEDFVAAHTEFRLPSHRRMDIYLRFRNGGLAIENKPWATDQKNQLFDYARYLESQHTKAQWLLIYLSNGEVSEYTLPKQSSAALTDQVVGLDFFQLARWLEDCAQNTRAHAVRLFVEAIAQFVREQINGELIVENGQELTALILRTENNVRAAFQISQQLHAAKRQVWQDFQASLRQQISHLHVEILVDEGLADGASHCTLGIRFSPEDVCGPAWAFNKRNHQELYFGICAWSQEEIANMRNDAISKAMTEFCGISSLAPTKWWPWWTFDTRAFSAYPIHSNWNTDPDAWLNLINQSENGFAAQIIDIATRFSKEFNLSLFRRKP
ncbi:PD-(D/E)XK nuclease family protein [Pseudomonas putida]|uniref:PDDEXK-like family protein n=1 Tax=Pseudomonas putida TaxID=303 RepID=UPI000281E77B|nr:PD-(D/E)XK nuclease family protein [Pseudomonas putida]